MITDNECYICNYQTKSFIISSEGQYNQARIQKMLNRGRKLYKLSEWTGEGGGANLFFGLTYKGEQGGVRRVRPL